MNKPYDHPYFKPFACWVIWMVFGSIYYAHSMNLGWSKGFYMAVNVGYSIGWGYPSENSNGSRVFSTFYVLVGSSAVAASLGYFAQSMIASSKNWYAKALTEEKFKSASSMDKCIYWAKMNEGALKIIATWFLWIIAMIIFSLCTVKWNFSEALYFAVSSLSTGGLWAIPSDSPEWYFGVVGAFAATGIPLMALAMANIAALVITVGDPDEAEKTIAAKVTYEELHMMQKFDLDDGDGEISRAEYILLRAVRLAALSPELIGKINDRFKKLDTSGDGALSYAEILEHSEEETINIVHEFSQKLENDTMFGSRKERFSFVRTLSMTSAHNGLGYRGANSAHNSGTELVELAPLGSVEAPAAHILEHSKTLSSRTIAQTSTRASSSTSAANNNSADSAAASSTSRKTVSRQWRSRSVSREDIKDSLLGSGAGKQLYSDQV